MESIRFRSGSRWSNVLRRSSAVAVRVLWRFFRGVRRRRFLPVVVAESFSSSFGLSFPRYFRGAFRARRRTSRAAPGTTPGRASAWKTSAGAAAPSAVPSAPQHASARNPTNASPSRTHAGAMLSASFASARVFERAFASGLVGLVPVGRVGAPETPRNPPAARRLETVKQSAEGSSRRDAGSRPARRAAAVADAKHVGVATHRKTYAEASVPGYVPGDVPGDPPSIPEPARASSAASASRRSRRQSAHAASPHSAHARNPKLSSRRASHPAQRAFRSRAARRAPNDDSFASFPRRAGISRSESSDRSETSKSSESSARTRATSDDGTAARRIPGVSEISLGGNLFSRVAAAHSASAAGLSTAAASSSARADVAAHVAEAECRRVQAEPRRFRRVGREKARVPVPRSRAD